jgi:hypothetical protein
MRPNDVVLHGIHTPEGIHAPQTPSLKLLQCKYNLAMLYSWAYFLLPKKVAPHIDKSTRTSIRRKLRDEGLGLLDEAFESRRGGFAEADCETVSIQHCRNMA